MSKDIDPQILRKILRYDPDTGKLFWLARAPSWFGGKTPARSEFLAKVWNQRYAGEEALGAVHHTGRKHGHILGRMYFAHRVVWALVHGEWPDDLIDHENGDPVDNRIKNLRCVNSAGNMSNRKLTKNSISGVHGVTWHKRMKRWQVSIRKRFVGTFETLVEAVSARLAAEHEDGGFHPNHGRINCQIR